MATLTDDFDDDEVAPAPEQALTWQWATWPRNLRRAVLSCLGIVIVCSAFFALWNWADADFVRRLKTQNELQIQAKSKLLHSGQERQDIELHLPLLKQLETAGIYGEEKRLEWIELLRSIEKRWPGIRIQYAISAQTLQPNPNAPPVNPAAQALAATLPNGELAKSLGIFNTEMKLTLRLLHEGDALAIVEEIKAAGLGHFTLRGCTFRRPNLDPITNSVPNPAANFGKAVDAECTLNWTSLRTYVPT